MQLHGTSCFCPLSPALRQSGPVWPDPETVTPANTIVEDADGNYVRSCVKGGQAAGHCMGVAWEGGFQ
jgi:hypothetical protein